jgi:nucleolar pre-ribosomal-associated protein 1
LCSALVDSVFERIQVLTADSDIAHPKSVVRSYTVRYTQDVLDSVLKYPLISLSSPCPLSSYKDLADGSLEHLEEALTAFPKENLHHSDCFVLNLLSKLYDLMLMVGSSEADYSRFSIASVTVFHSKAPAGEHIVTIQREI